jgi:secondary thiamine-phosphate synthase enzyme
MLPGARHPLRGSGATVAAMWAQGEIALGQRPRGYHLITREVLEAVPRIGEVEVGLLHLFLRHTSASLTLNENASPDVRADFEAYFDAAVPEQAPYWTHTLEGADDMPAHVKASLLGASLTIPVAHGRLALGTWQGVYLCEHRDHGGPRSLVATLWGESAP